MKLATYGKVDPGLAARTSTSTLTTTPGKNGKQTRQQIIQGYLDVRGTCTCAITPDSTDDELMREIKSCTDGYQCQTIDRIRARVVDYNRNWKEVTIV
jgi:hypothetical protein